MNIKHPFVKPEIECTLAAGCAVTGEPFAIELAHVNGRLTMVSAKPIKAGAGGGSGGLKPALTSLDLSDGMDTGRTYHCPHCGNKNIVRCGKCHGITCYDGSGSFVCVHCGNSGSRCSGWASKPNPVSSVSPASRPSPATPSAAPAGNGADNLFPRLLVGESVYLHQSEGGHPLGKRTSTPTTKGKTT